MLQVFLVSSAKKREVFTIFDILEIKTNFHFVGQKLYFLCFRVDLWFSSDLIITFYLLTFITEHKRINHIMIPRPKCSTLRNANFGDLICKKTTLEIEQNYKKIIYYVLNFYIMYFFILKIINIHIFVPLSFFVVDWNNTKRFLPSTMNEDKFPTR